METKKLILVPVDFQEASLAALTLAREIGSRLGMEIVLLHAFSTPVAIYPGMEPIMTTDLSAELEATARQSLDSLADSVGCRRSMVVAGDPTSEILKAIEALAPAFVVMGTHGRRWLSHLLMGSVAEKVFRSSLAPVITVHAPAQRLAQAA